MADIDRQYLIRFGPNANCTFELCTIDESVYGYRPSIIANAIFAALFGLATFVHVFLGLKWKTKWFMWCMILSCTHEVTGYVGRILLYTDPWNFVAFIIQIICITQAPVFYCAAIYVMLAQIINHYSPSLARFPPRFLVWIFIPCDIISLSCQGAGGGLSAASSGSSQLGVKIAMVGLILQIVTLVVFSCLFGDYLVRYLRSGPRAALQSQEKISFSFMILGILATLARCIYRAYELNEGYEGEAIKDEAAFIGLEGVLVVISVFCLCVAHPGFMFKSRVPQYQAVAVGENGILLAKRETAYPDLVVGS